MGTKAELIDEVERLTEITQQLATLLRERIDECTKLEDELERLTTGSSMVLVTTDIGDDFVHATVNVKGKSVLETEVINWFIDGIAMPLSSLKGEDELTLRHLAMEKINE